MACLSALVVLLATLSTQTLHAQASLSLNGANQFVLVPPNTNFTPTNLTFEAWVYPKSTSCNTILSRGDGTYGNLTDYILNVGYNTNGCGTMMTVGFFAAGAWDTSSNTVPLNAWTHVAVTYDGTNKRFYINGVLDRTAVATNSLYSTPGSPLLIGMQGTTCTCNFFNGQLAEVHVWNTVRTASQIQSDVTYSSGAQPGLVAYYHLDEGSGTSAYDATGNGNTGTLEFGASWSSLAPPLGQLVVGNINDSGPGTLREAIADATNGELITFAPNLSGSTIMLASTLTISNTSLTIDASVLPGGIQINGNGAVQVFNIGPSTVTPSIPTVILNSLTITNGYASGSGGGIFNAANLTLNQCTVSGNRASGGGGGIFSFETLTLNQCTVSGNRIGNGSTGAGGGIYNSDTGTLMLNQCTVWGNVAAYGAIANYISSGRIIVNECTVFGNPSGGIFLESNIGPDGGYLALTNTIVAGNFGGYNLLADIVINSGIGLNYGGSNIVQTIQNVGTITGPAPLTNAPDLLPLGNYGGPTQTMPPAPGSPAIRAGSVAANTFTTDQRGYPRTQNGLIDLGAVELPIVQPFTANPTKGLVPLPVHFSSTAVDSDGSAILYWSWSFGDGNISSLQNPTNIYETAGPFSPALIVTNTLGLGLSVPGPAISVYQPLALTGVSLSGTNLTLNGSNGISGLAYTVLTSTNLNLPLNQWTPLVTNTWSTNGAFSVILTNVQNPPVPHRFYRFGTR
jgi:PKD repeat protein